MKSTGLVTKYYDGNLDNDELPEDLGASDRDEIGIIRAICMKVGHNLVFNSCCWYQDT